MGGAEGVTEGDEGPAVVNGVNGTRPEAAENEASLQLGRTGEQQKVCVIIVLLRVFGRIYQPVVRTGGGVCSTVVACWTAGQQVEQSILHLVHDSYQNSISLS